MKSILAGRKYPLQQRIEDKKRGIGRQKHPFVGMFSRPFPIFGLKFAPHPSMGFNCFYVRSVHLRADPKCTTTGKPYLTQGRCPQKFCVITNTYLKLPASHQSYARSIWERSYQSWGTFPAMYEACDGRPSVYSDRLYDALYPLPF